MDHLVVYVELRKATLMIIWSKVFYILVVFGESGKLFDHILL